MNNFETYKGVSVQKVKAGQATLDAIRYCLSKNPQNILELGGGIGTISKLILEESNATLDIYEHKDVFQEALKENLKQWEGRYTILPNYLILPPKRDYDLIIVDGGGKGSIDMHDFHQAIGLFIKSLNSVKMILIEGQRKRQKHWIIEALKERYTYTVTTYSDPLDGKKISVRLDCTPCANPIKRYIHHILKRRKVVKKLTNLS